jgi:hypothetical protein
VIWLLLADKTIDGRALGVSGRIVCLNWNKQVQRTD